MYVSVVVPTKNEPSAGKLAKEIHRQLARVKHEIIVVDKSTMPPKIKNVRLLIQKSDGLGNAVLEGVKAARGDVLVTMDADFSHRPQDIKKLLEKMDYYDVAIGSRFVEGGKTTDVAHRRIVSFLMRKIVSLLLWLPIKDNMSGFIAVRASVYKKFKLNPIGYKINMEILYKARKAGLKIAEVPITFVKRRQGKSKAGIGETLKILLYILRLQFERD